MIDFILLLIVGALWCWGVFTIFHEGYALGRVGDMFRKEPAYNQRGLQGTWYSKPLFDCPPCMASVHGGLIGLFYFGLCFQVLTFMICLCGLNFIVKSILYPEYE